MSLIVLIDLNNSIRFYKKAPDKQINMLGSIRIIQLELKAVTPVFRWCF